MTKSYSPVNTNTDSFEIWVNKTNDLLVDMSNVIVTSDADGSSGVTNGSITISNTVSANTGVFTTGLFNTIMGGNTTSSNTVTIAADTIISGTTFTSNANTIFNNNVNFMSGTNYLKIWDTNSSNYYSVVTGNITSNYVINMAAGDVTLQPGTLVPTTGTGATGNWGINANTASAWATARTISLSGDASGSVTINGSSNATLSITVTDNSHNHTIANITGLQTSLDGKQSLDSTLTALSIYNTNGILTQTASDTFVGRSIAGTTNQITVTNGDGVSGNPTVAAVTASQAEAEAGADGTKLMTPLRVAQAITARSPAPTAAEVGSATADLSAGAVGTYAILLAQNDSFEFSRGSNYAGSNFYYMHFNQLDGGATLRGFTITTPSGTWKALASSTNGGDRNTNGALFLRVS